MLRFSLTAPGPDNTTAKLTINWAAYISIVVAIVGSIIAGSMRFASLEARVTTIETFVPNATTKLDTISATLARIEGRLDEARDETEREYRKNTNH